MARAVEFGMNVAVLPGTPHGEPTNVADLAGTKWVRMVFFFSRHFNMNEAEAFAYYDKLVDKYAAQGIGTLFVLIQDTFWGNGPWDSGGWEVYAENFANVAGKIATHFKGKPVAYQIWNEPDLAAGSSIQLDPKHYAIILTAVTKAIKAADINSTVIFSGLAKGAGDAAQYVQKVKAACPNGRLPVDGLAIHFYGQYVGNTRPTDDEQPGGIFGSLEESMKLFRRGVPDIPVWITEIGIVQHDDDFCWNDAQNAAIARYIERVINYIQRNHSDWVRAVTWFAWGDIMENGGMVDLEGNKKPQYGSFINTVQSIQVEESPYILTPITRLNVRRADYTQYEKVAVVQDGAPMTVLEPPALAKAKLSDENSQQWICVQNPDDNSVAWVAAWLMEVAEESPLSIRRIGGQGFVNLRSGDMGELDRIGQIEKGDKVIPLEDPAIANEKIRLSNVNETPDEVKNWILVETPFGQKAWVAAWYMSLHPESETPPAISDAGTAGGVIPPPPTDDVGTRDGGISTALKSSDELIAILGEEVKKYATAGEVEGDILFPLTDDMHRTYAVNVVGQSGASILVLAHVSNDKIIIEADAKKLLAGNLQNRGVSREQIVLVYDGEARPT